MNLIRRRSHVLSVAILLNWVAASEHLFADDLRNPANQADYIVIAPSCYISQAQRLSTFRRDHDGLSATVVLLEDITAQFRTTSSADTALKTFLDHALSSWAAPRPSYVVLMGNVNVMPTHVEPELPSFVYLGYTDSVCTDHWFVEGPVDQWGYGRMRCAIGRFSGWDSTEIARMVGRTIEYETATPEPWWGRSLGLADYNSVDLGDFEYLLHGYQRTASAVWMDTVTVTMDTSSPQYADSSGFRRLWDQGAAIMVYAGHANAYNFAAVHYFTVQSAASLQNAPRFPLFLSIGCSLRYDLPDPTIVARLMSNPSGGAIAAVVSAGVQWASVGDAIVGGILDTLAKKTELTAGKAFGIAKDAGQAVFGRRYTYLGDPALKVKHPPLTTARPGLDRLPRTVLIEQNYPNPFNPSTTIRYGVPARSRVLLNVFNVLGQQVATLQDGEVDAGVHEVHFDARGLSSGVYFYRIYVGAYSETKQMMMVR